MDELERYFIDLISGVRSSRFIDASATKYVIKHILVDPPAASGIGMPVLTWMHRDASAMKGERRKAAYKKLGDTALFLSGVFPSYVTSTPGGLGFYVDMGTNAYGQASSMVPRRLIDEFRTIVLVINDAIANTTLCQRLETSNIVDMHAFDGSGAFRYALALRNMMPIGNGIA